MLCLIRKHWNICYTRGFTFARIDISYARFFFYESAEKVLSYARLNCVVFNYFYMSLGQVRHVVYRFEYMALYKPRRDIVIVIKLIQKGLLSVSSESI